MTYRSLLFVPGVRPERFGKALAAGADTVCIDLEDAVPPDGKDAARDAVVTFLREPGALKAGVRVNGPSTSEWEADCAALSAVATNVAFIMIPKVEAASQIDRTRAALGQAAPPVWAVIESAEGLMNAWDIAGAGLAGVLFGGADYSADLGCTMDWDALLFARGALAAACARSGVDLMDVPWLDVGDDAGLAESTRRVKAMGFTGRACIHPTQVATINAAFSPTEAEISRSRRILEAFEVAGGGAALLDGKLIDLPVIRAARRTLERAGDA